jgi:hypothetical protein
MALNIAWFVKRVLPSFSKNEIVEDLETSLEYISAITESYSNLSSVIKVSSLNSKANLEIIKSFYNEIKGNNIKVKLSNNKNIANDTLALFNNVRINGEYLLRKISEAVNDVIVSQALTAKRANLIRAAGHYYFLTKYAIDLSNYIYIEESTNAGFELSKKYNLQPKQKEFIIKNLWIYARMLSIYGDDHDKFKSKLSAIEDIMLHKDEVDDIVEIYKSDKVDIFNNLPFNFIGSPIYSVRLVFAQWSADRYRKLRDQKKLLELRYLHLKLMKEQNNTDINIEKEIESIQERLTTIDKNIYSIEKEIGD